MKYKVITEETYQVTRSVVAVSREQALEIIRNFQTINNGYILDSRLMSHVVSPVVEELEENPPRPAPAARQRQQQQPEDNGDDEVEMVEQ